METETELRQRASLAQFDDPKNITSGNARVIWATACCPIRSSEQPDGWVLPGGIRTTDKHEATAYAVRLNRMLSGR